MLESSESPKTRMDPLVMRPHPTDVPDKQTFSEDLSATAWSSRQAESNEINEFHGSGPKAENALNPNPGQLRIQGMSVTDTQRWLTERRERLRRYVFYLLGFKDDRIPNNLIEQDRLFLEMKYQWRGKGYNSSSMRDVAESLGISATSLRHYSLLGQGRDIWDLNFESVVALSPNTMPSNLRSRLPEYMRQWDCYGLHYWVSFGQYLPQSQSISNRPSSAQEWVSLVKQMPGDPQLLESIEQVLSHKRLWGASGVDWPALLQLLELSDWSLAQLDSMANALVFTQKTAWGQNYFSCLSKREVSAEQIYPYSQEIARLLSCSVSQVKQCLHCHQGIH